VRSVLLTGIDQPRPPVLYASLRQEADRSAESIIAPDKNGRCGHPIVCHSRLRHHLAHLSEEQQGLRGLLRGHQDTVYRLACDPTWLRWDFNTLAAYLEAFEWFRENLSRCGD
jgi:CTP:molybdopterin cytidylyltransferase MocA